MAMMRLVLMGSMPKVMKSMGMMAVMGVGISRWHDSVYGCMMGSLGWNKGLMLGITGLRDGVQRGVVVHNI